MQHRSRLKNAVWAILTDNVIIINTMLNC